MTCTLLLMCHDIIILFHTDFNAFQSPPDPLLAFILSTLHFHHFWGPNITWSFLNTYFHIYIYIISYISSSFYISYHYFIRDVSYHHLLHIFFVIYHIIISYSILSFRISYHHLTHIKNNKEMITIIR